MPVKMPAGGSDFSLTCTHVHVLSLFFFPPFASLHLASICRRFTAALPKVHSLCLGAAADPPRSALKAPPPAGAINISILLRSLRSWG